MMSVLEKNSICRVCLKVDVKICRVNNSEHKTLIEKLINIKFPNVIINEDFYACYICMALLSKTYNFVQTVFNAQEIILNLSKETYMITKHLVKQINRHKKGLNPINLTSLVIHEENHYNSENFNKKADIIKKRELNSELEQMNETDRYITKVEVDSAEDSDAIKEQYSFSSDEDIGKQVVDKSKLCNVDICAPLEVHDHNQKINNSFKLHNLITQAIDKCYIDHNKDVHNHLQADNIKENDPLVIHHVIDTDKENSNVEISDVPHLQANDKVDNPLEMCAVIDPVKDKDSNVEISDVPHLQANDKVDNPLEMCAVIDPVKDKDSNVEISDVPHLQANDKVDDPLEMCAVIDPVKDEDSNVEICYVQGDGKENDDYLDDSGVIIRKRDVDLKDSGRNYNNALIANNIKNSKSLKKNRQKTKQGSDPTQKKKQSVSYIETSSENESSDPSEKRKKSKKKEDIDYQPDSTSHSEDSDFDSYDDRGQRIKRPQHGRLYPRNCDHCNDEMESARKHHSHYLLIHPNIEYPYSEEKITCSFCGKLFTPQYLAHHLLTHAGHTLKKVKCTICLKVFNNRVNLYRHRSTVHPKNTLTCDYCSKIFKTRRDIIRHIRIHTGEKPFKCHICGAGFAHSGNRTIHIRSAHQNIKYVPKKQKQPRKERKNKKPISFNKEDESCYEARIRKKRKKSQKCKRENSDSENKSENARLTLITKPKSINKKDVQKKS